MKPKFRSLIAAFSPFRSASTFICATLCAASSVHADQTWTGATDATWNTAGNWSSAVPGFDENAVFAASSLSNLSIDTVADQEVGGILLTSPAGPVTISNNTLTIGAGGIDMSAATQSLTLGSNVALMANTAQSWAVASGQSLTLNGALTVPVGTAANIDLSAGGTVNIPSGTASTILAGTSYNGVDFAALDASNNVVSGDTVVTYTPNPEASIYFGPFDFCDVVNDNDTPFNFNAFRLTTSTYLNDGEGIRFNTPHPNGEPWYVNLNSSLYGDTINGRIQFVVGSAIDTDVIFEGGGTFRTNKSGVDYRYQNFSSSNLIINCGMSERFASSLTKSGPGPITFTNNFNTRTNGYFILEGDANLGNGGASGALSGGGIHLSAGTNFNLNRSDDVYTLGLVIDGEGSVSHIGSGTIGLSGINSYTGGTFITNGAIGASSADNFGFGDVLIDGGGVRFDAVFDLTEAIVTIGSSGATLNTNGNDITLLGGFESGSTGGLTKSGAGSLSLEGANDYSGGTTVAEGTLLANAAGSSTGSGAVTVNSGATLGGDGTIGGLADIAAGGILSPGNSVGELTVGSLNLAAGSLGVIEFNSTPANDHVVVTGSGGLTISGGSLALVQEGSTTPFTTPGTYSLISYSGSIGGAGVSALSVSNGQPGYSYTFADTGSEVTLTIATSGLVAEWATDGGGLWTDASNWSTDPTIPDGAGETAIFNTELTSPAVVDLNGPKTVGAMSFDSSNGYTLGQGGSGALTLNNSGGGVDIAVLSGVHEISADVALAEDTMVEALDAVEGLDITGAVSGAGGITKTGAGSLGLLASNSFTGDVDLQGGTTTFASGGLGAGGTVSLDGSSLVWASGNTDDISAMTVAFGTNPVTLDTNGNDVSLANPIGDGGDSDLVKAGGGTLTLAEDADFFGNVNIADGSLQLGTGGTTGWVFGDILNDGALVVSRSDDAVLDNIISGTGSLEQAGGGDIVLTSANTFSGTTTITSGTLTLGNPLALQESTLAYNTGGGTLSFDLLTTATFGGLSGDLDLALLNADVTPAAVALTVGGNDDSTFYSGVLSGAGSSLTKIGTGFLTLEGVNTYDASTHVSEGTLEVTGEIVSNNTITTGAGGVISVAGGTINATSFGDIEGQLLIDFGGEANYNGGVRGDNSDGSLIHVIDGTLNTPLVERRRDVNLGSDIAGPSVTPGSAGIVGLVVGFSGVANIVDINCGTSNTGGQVVVDGGELNVSGTFNVGNTSNNRWSLVDARFGALNVTDTTLGMVLAPNAATANKAAFYASGAVCKVGRITFGEASAAEGYGLVDVTGELYMGSGGLVQEAPVFNSTFRLSGGTLGAYENWSTSLPLTLAGISTINASDDNFNPFDIELAGGVIGDGGIIKGGEGMLTLSGPNTYTGFTEVWSGVLRMTSATLDDDATVGVFAADGATLDLAFAGEDLVKYFEIDGFPQPDGIYGAIGSGAPNETEAITGTGLLNVMENQTPASAYDGWAETAGLDETNNGPTDDAEFDGIENVLEYVLGGDPLVSDTEILPDVDASGANYVFTFTRSDESESEVALTFQYGNDLDGWTDVVIGADDAGSGPEVAIVEDDANPDQITVTVPKSGTAMFGRLRAVK